MMREPLTEASTTKIVQWLERHVGGRVVRITRQPRWRPVWFADVDDSHSSQWKRPNETTTLGSVLQFLQCSLTQVFR